MHHPHVIMVDSLHSVIAKETAAKKKFQHIHVDTIWYSRLHKPHDSL